ncbi:phosphatase PAP2 family protein [Hyphomicrobium facile]|uniref:Undecaprenyl-diphosphatase n=1 Tax=Hyphomicrobium facile TaxID=51670 RepID=A0A1I7NVV7_9HYPH|nr:phosphatase PAP2 family protein [Hyphomicrobium facile]SFV38782.1 undecaprenyl-diphosphatase [Hyphomicrobium facile]
MNAVDAQVMRVLGQYAHRSETADRFIIGFLGLGSIKLLPIVALVWALWFRKHERELNRSDIASGLIGVIAAFVISRFLQDILPERPRPFFSGAHDFVLPFYADDRGMEKWSSFPSDHAVISFALATIIFLISRPLGLVSYFWSFFVVCLPRVYGGLHYASDILAGALIGISAVVVSVKAFSKWPWLAQRLLAMEMKYPSAFYGSAFFFSYQIVTLFDDFRKSAQAVGTLFLW